MPESREEIAKLEALYANNPAGRVFTHLAEAYRKAGEHDRALGILGEGIQKHPGYASAYVVLGRVYMDLQKNDEATDAFRRVIDLDPHNLVALRSLGDLARTAGRRDEALKFFEELRHQDPGNDEIEQIITDLQEAPAASGSPTEPDEPRSVTEEYSAPSEVHEAWQGAREPWEEEETREAASASADQTSASEREPWESSYAEPAQSQEPITSEQNESADFQLGWLPDALHDQTPEPAPDELVNVSDLSDVAEARPWDSTDATDELGDLSSLGTVGQEFEVEGETFKSEDINLSVPVDAVSANDSPEPATADGEVVTETIAELYRNQGLYERAAEVYRALLRERPGSAELEAKLTEVEELMRPQVQSANEPDEPWQEPEPWATPELDAEEAAAWLAGSTDPAESTPTPYAWTEQPTEISTDTGRPIRAYFQSLLSWQPRSATSAEASETSDATTASEAFEEWFGGSESSVAQSPEDQPREGSSVDAADGSQGAEGDDDDDLEMFRSWLQSLKK